MDGGEGRGGAKADVNAGALALPGAAGVEAVPALFVPDAAYARAGTEVVDARTVMELLR